MIVVCTGCSAKFRVADEKVGPRGAKLRCSKCQTIFLVKRPLEPLPVAVVATPSDPFAAVPAAPPRAGPPPLPRRTTLDARAAFEVDLEPNLGAVPPSVDPFAPSPGLADADPFAAAESRSVAVPAPAPVPALAHEPAPAREGALAFDPFEASAGDSPLSDPFGALGGERFERPPQRATAPPSPRDQFETQAGSSSAARAAAGTSISLEELTTPPARRLAAVRSSEPAPMALLASTEDPFGAVAPLGPGLSELDAGVSSSTGPRPGVLPSGASFPVPERVEEAPLQFDPFTAAAVAADPLAVDEPSRAVAAPPAAETTADRPVPRRTFQVKEVLVSAMALAALLLLALAILVVWRGGLAPADALRPSAIVAALAPRPLAGALSISGVTSGLYERARGAPLLFVRGQVVSSATSRLDGVSVVVEVVRDGAVLARGEALAGAVPGPEALYGAVDAAALARAMAEAVPAAAPLAPGGTVPFLVVFTDYPANLAGASLRVQPVAGTAR